MSKQGKYTSILAYQQKKAVKTGVSGYVWTVPDHFTISFKNLIIQNISKILLYRLLRITTDKTVIVSLFHADAHNTRHNK